MAVEAFIPELWHSKIMVNFAERAVIAGAVNREYEGTAQRGNVVKVASFTQPGVVDYATGNGSGARTLAPEDLSASTQDLSISEEKAFGFYVDDIDRAQAAGSMSPIAADASNALVEDSETFLQQLLLDNGTDSTAGDTVTTGNEAFDMILRLRTELSASTVKAPLDGRFLIVNPEFSQHLLGADSKLVEVDTSGETGGLRNASIGRLLGFTVAETSLLSPGRACAMALHRSGAGFVSQLNNVESVRAPDRFADIVRGLHVYGGKVLRGTAVRYWREAAPTG